MWHTVCLRQNFWDDKQSLVVAPWNRKMRQCLGGNLRETKEREEKERQDFSLLSSPL